MSQNNVVQIKDHLTLKPRRQHRSRSKSAYERLPFVKKSAERPNWQAALSGDYAARNQVI